MQFTNKNNLPLPIALWLAADSYDLKPSTKIISASAFTKSVRRHVLSSRVDPSLVSKDVIEMLPSRLGSAIHDAIERSMLDDGVRNKALKLLGIDDDMINKVIVNPAPGEDLTDRYPIYLEQRSSVELGGYTISGKFDIVYDSGLSDYKTTRTWKYAKLSDAEEDYRIQGSIYRYINPTLITKDTLKIILIFLDWSKARATLPNYPPAPIVTFEVKLMTPHETEDFILQYLADLDKAYTLDNSDLEECTPKQLWQNKPVYKYYKNPDKQNARSTCTSEKYADVYAQYCKNGNVGVIKPVFGQARACSYCDAFTICDQAQRLVLSGLIEVQNV